MKTVTVVIRKTDDDLSSFCVDKYNLARLITDIKLYHKDMMFISDYIIEYSEINCNGFLPTEDGIIFIDMVNDLILDSQGITGINKITPAEIKRSKNGSIPDETTKNSIYHRFLKLFNAGYLVGFHEWRDNGNHVNKDILKLDLDEIIDLIMDTNYHYGQFVFNTKPFKVETFNEVYFDEQTHLFNRAVELNLIPTDKHDLWKKYLKGLKQ